MKSKIILAIINQSLMILEKDVGLAQTTLEKVRTRSFKPITAFFDGKKETFYNEALINEFEEHQRIKFQHGAITRKDYNHRIRGIKILREVHDTNTFSWKGPANKINPKLPESFENIITGLTNPNISENKNRHIKSVIRRFLLSLTGLGINNIAQVKAEHIQAFLSDISKSRAKSMEHVIMSLRKLDRYLSKSGFSGLQYAGLLMAPRARERKIYPYMPQDDLNLVLKSIDRSTAMGKRDYAILLLAASTGLRSGDITNIKLSDIDWHKNEICIVQGKTQSPINIPLRKGVGAALADYILNGRPESKSAQVFLRNVAPFQRFKHGGAIADVLRRQMKTANISHEIGDGKTMHGIRRMLGTQMVIEGIPVTTVAQVLGHQNTNALSPYISLNIEGLRECALGFNSLKEDSK